MNHSTSIQARVCVSAIAALIVCAAPIATAQRTAFYRVGAPQVDRDQAPSKEDANADHTRDFSCPIGHVLKAITGTGATWGTYPALESIGLWCASNTGAADSQRVFGKAAQLAKPKSGKGDCKNDRVVNGMQVDSDR